MADPIGVLEDLEIEEVSFVAKPANDQADVVIFKSAGGDPFRSDEDRDAFMRPLVETFDVHAAFVYKDKIDDLKAELVVEMRKKLIAALKEATTPVGLEDAFWHTMNELRKAATGPRKENKMAENTIENVTKERDEAVKKVAALEAEVVALKKTVTPKPDPAQAESPEVRARLEKAEKEAKASEIRIAALETERDVAKFVGIVKKDMPNVSAEHGKLASILKSAKDALTEDDFNELTRVLKAASEQVKTGDVFKQAAAGGTGPVSQDPTVEVNKRAAELQKVNPKLELADAIGQVLNTDQALYNRYTAATQVKV